MQTIKFVTTLLCFVSFYHVFQCTAMKNMENMEKNFSCTKQNNSSYKEISYIKAFLIKDFYEACIKNEYLKVEKLFNLLAQKIPQKNLFNFKWFIVNSDSDQSIQLIPEVFLKASFNGFNEIAKFLITKFPEELAHFSIPESQENKLNLISLSFYHACSTGNTDLAKLIINHFKNQLLTFNILTTINNKVYNANLIAHSLDAACRKNQPAIVTLLLKEFNNYFTQLEVTVPAEVKNSIKKINCIAKSFFQVRFDKNSTIEKQLRPFFNQLAFSAAKKGNYLLFKPFLKQIKPEEAQNVSIAFDNTTQQTNLIDLLFYTACDQGHTKIAKKILNRFESKTPENTLINHTLPVVVCTDTAKINHASDSLIAQSFYKACIQGHKEVAQLLLTMYPKLLTNAERTVPVPLHNGNEKIYPKFIFKVLYETYLANQKETLNEFINVLIKNNSLNHLQYFLITLKKYKKDNFLAIKNNVINLAKAAQNNQFLIWIKTNL